MRSSNQILAEIKKIEENDKKYNNFINEGGEGFEQNNVTKELYIELFAAQENEFKNEWTLEVFNSHRASWNKKLLELTNNTGFATIKILIQVQNETGLKESDLAKAKKFLNL